MKREEFVANIRTAHEAICKAVATLDGVKPVDLDEAGAIGYQSGMLDSALEILEQFMPEMVEAEQLLMADRLEQAINETEASAVLGND